MMYQQNSVSNNLFGREIVRPRLTRKRLNLNDETDNDRLNPSRTLWQVSDVQLPTRPPLYPPPVLYRMVRSSPSTVAARIDAFLKKVAVCHHDETSLTAYYATGDSIQVFLFKHNANVTMVECLGSSKHAISILLAAQGSSTKKMKSLKTIQSLKQKEQLMNQVHDDGRRVYELLKKDRIDAQKLGMQLLLILLQKHNYHSLLLGSCQELPLESQYIHKFCLNNVMNNSTLTCLSLQSWSHALSNKDLKFEPPEAFVQALWKHVQGCNRPPGQPEMSSTHEAHYACKCLFAILKYFPHNIDLEMDSIEVARQCHFYKPLQEEAERLWNLASQLD